MRETIEMLANHELALGRLYETFARKFDSARDFWLRLAAEEQRHAEWLRTLLTGTARTAWLSHVRLPNRSAVALSLGYLEKQISRAQEGNISLMEALAIARDVENALLEKRFFSAGDEASPEVRSVLRNLAAGAEKHRKAVDEALDAEKRLGKRSPS